MKLTLVVAAAAALLASGTFGHAQVESFSRMPDPRGEFIRLCAPYMIKRSSHPEAVCDCLHSKAVAMIDDVEVRDALLSGISETGVPSVDYSRLPQAKGGQIDAMLSRIARPTMTCIYGEQ